MSVCVCVCVFVCVSVCMCLCLCLCVCVFVKLHITAQSGPVILGVCVYLLNCACVCVCARIYEIAHNRAIRRCHPSHSMPLALILPRGAVCVCVFIKLHITAQSGPVILVILCHSY